MAINSSQGEGIFPPALSALSHHELRDPADLAAALQRSAPMRHCHSMVPDRQFSHRVGYLEMGQMVVVSQSGTATDFLVEHTPNYHLLTVVHGQLSLQTAGGSVALGPRGVALLPAGLRHSQGRHSLASITLVPAAVAAAAAAMAGHPKGSRKAPAIPATFPVLHLGSGTDAGMVHSLLRTINTCVAVNSAMATHLGLDDVIHRSAAALLHPALLEEEPADLLRYRDQAGQTNFDDLIDFIRSNLNQPLRLSDLEARSHYSRRALQYAFRERLNSTPKQWIREQRLSLALEQLQGQVPRPSIQEVALRCGYRHLRQFSQDFKARFGISPSQAKRT